MIQMYFLAGKSRALGNWRESIWELEGEGRGEVRVCLPLDLLFSRELFFRSVLQMYFSFDQLEAARCAAMELGEELAWRLEEEQVDERER
jgi:hypothetical protein